MKPGEGIRFAADGPRWRTSPGGDVAEGYDEAAAGDPMGAGESLPRILTGSPIGEDEDDGVVTMPTFWRRMREGRGREAAAPTASSRRLPLTFALRRGAMIVAGIAAAVLLLVAFVGGFLLASSFLGVDTHPSLGTAERGGRMDQAAGSPLNADRDTGTTWTDVPAPGPAPAAAPSGEEARTPAVAVLSEGASVQPSPPPQSPIAPVPAPTVVAPAEDGGSVIPTVAGVDRVMPVPMSGTAVPPQTNATEPDRTAEATAPVNERAPIAETVGTAESDAADPEPLVRARPFTPSATTSAPARTEPAGGTITLRAPPPKPAPPAAAEGPAEAARSVPQTATPEPERPRVEQPVAPPSQTASVPAATGPAPGPPTQIVPRVYQPTFASREAREPAGEVFRGMPPIEVASGSRAAQEARGDRASAAEPSGPLAAGGAPGIAAGPFAVQLGAFRDPGNAGDVLGRLRARGYAPQVVAPPSAASQTLHIVLLGGVAGRSDADALVGRLKGQGFDAFVRDLR